MSVLNPTGPKSPPLVLNAESAFVGRDLAALNDPLASFALPLACIGLIDLNAFFAQCEQIRLGKTIDDPVVCCQWLSLIAVLYAARKYGIGRMDSLQSAREKCPGLIVGHAAVFRKGEAHWQYLDKLPDQLLHKVSLDPYRRELRKIIKVLKRECDLVEKASVDECYLDFGRAVYARMVEAFPFLESVGPDEPLPPVPLLPLDFYWVGGVQTEEETAKAQDELEQSETNGEELVPEEKLGLNDVEKPKQPENSPPVQDWDDVCILVASQLLYKARCAIYSELKYTTSGGVGNSKTVAKLAGGFIKPDFQTVVPPRLAKAFFSHFHLSDFTMMGGKTGELVLQKLLVPPDCNSIEYIRENWPLDRIEAQFPSEPQLARKVYELVRGIHHQELKLRTDVKSMMSRKNFTAKNPVNTLSDAFDWIKVFVGDLYGRLVELDDENMNLSASQSQAQGFIYRPRTASIQVTTTSYSRYSKQTSIVVLRDLDKFRHNLEATGFRLFCELMDGTKASEMNSGLRFKDLKLLDLDKTVPIPSLANLSLVVANFVKTSDANLIDSYGKSGSTENDMKRLFDEINVPKENPPPPPSKVKATRSNSYIKKLFTDFEAQKAEEAKTDDAPNTRSGFKEDKQYVEKMFSDFEASTALNRALSESPKKRSKIAEIPSSKPSAPPTSNSLLRELITSRFCSQCNVAVEDVFEHNDFHVALDLSLKLNGDSDTAKEVKSSPSRKTRLVKKGKGKGKDDKSQSRLPF